MEDLVRLDGKSPRECIPKQLVKASSWIDDDDDDDDAKVRVIDFGEAFPMDAVPGRLAQPDGLQTPETIFTNTFDYKVDLWRAGLMVRLPPLPKRISLYTY